MSDEAMSNKLKLAWRYNDVVGQAFVRIFFAFVCSAYAYLGYTNGWLGNPPQELFYVSSIFLGLSLAHAVLVGFTHSDIWQYKVLGMTFDLTFATYCMIIGDLSTVFLYGIYLWIVIGNGLRFGRKYLYIANVLSIIGFSVVITFSPFWQQYPYIGGGMMLWLVLMPIYISKLLYKLEVAVQNADRANNAKSEFLANMSHEIRTPLTAIIGFSEIALDKEQTNEQRISSLETIRRSGTHLLNLINNILDFSKIDAGEFNIEFNDMDPVQTVADVESIIKIQAQKKGLKLNINYQYPLPVKIKSDMVRLKQILLNLCSNAIKFTDSGSVNLGVRFDTVTETLTFSVTDTGIGIEKEQLNKIFKPFKQADTSTTRKYGGTGLGLSLSKQLASLMGGQLIVRSLFERGTTFELSIPAGNVQQSELVNSASDYVDTRANIYHGAILNEQAEASNDESVTTSTVINNELPRLTGSALLVEDNEVNQELIALYLKKMGVDVTIANNGQEAVDIAENTEFDLIYMDMQMPVMSGVDAIRTLRARNYSKPIVTLTANATNEDKRQCSNAGSDGFLTKPITRATLYEMTSRYLKQKESLVV